MIKGSRKQMIVVRTKDSRYFDEAYFVLRREVEPNRCHPHDLISEVNHILEESTEKREKKVRGFLLGVLFFLSGGALGAGIALLCVLA